MFCYFYCSQVKDLSRWLANHSFPSLKYWVLKLSVRQRQNCLKLFLMYRWIGYSLVQIKRNLDYIFYVDFVSILHRTEILGQINVLSKAIFIFIGCCGCSIVGGKYFRVFYFKHFSKNLKYIIL